MSPHCCVCPHVYEALVCAKIALNSSTHPSLGTVILKCREGAVEVKRNIEAHNYRLFHGSNLYFPDIFTRDPKGPGKCRVEGENIREKQVQAMS